MNLKSRHAHLCRFVYAHRKRCTGAAFAHSASQQMCSTMTCMHTLTLRQQEATHWSRAFTERLTPDVKLVGSTISCEATLKDGDATKGSRQNAHVQSYAMATDQVQDHCER